MRDVIRCLELREINYFVLTSMVTLTLFSGRSKKKQYFPSRRWPIYFSIYSCMCATQLLDIQIQELQTDFGSAREDS